MAHSFPHSQKFSFHFVYNTPFSKLLQLCFPCLYNGRSPKLESQDQNRLEIKRGWSPHPLIAYRILSLMAQHFQSQSALWGIHYNLSEIQVLHYRLSKKSKLFVKHKVLSTNCRSFYEYLHTIKIHRNFCFLFPLWALLLLLHIGPGWKKW